jgi:hypothetical protein
MTFRILKEDAFVKHTDWDLRKANPMSFLVRKNWKRIESDKIHKGITATAGFYGPQGRIFTFKYSR